jgi:hypothetical protein
MNFLMPAKRNWLLPLEINKMKMTTTPLASKVDALETDMLALEKLMAASLEKKTVKQIASERINSQSRWDNNAGMNADAATLAAAPPGDGTDNGQPDDEQAAAKFDALVREIAARDKIPLAQASVRARAEHPEAYAALNRTDTTKSYRGLVEAEIAKGFSDTVARQKVAYAFPQAARESIATIAKSARVSEFMNAVNEIKKARGCSRTAALSTARREHPDLFARFENV